MSSSKAWRRGQGGFSTSERGSAAHHAPRRSHQLLRIPLQQRYAVAGGGTGAGTLLAWDLLRPAKRFVDRQATHPLCSTSQYICRALNPLRALSVVGVKHTPASVNFANGREQVVCA